VEVCQRFTPSRGCLPEKILLNSVAAKVSRLLGFYCSPLIQIVGFKAPWSYQKLQVAVQQNAQNKKVVFYCVSIKHGVYTLEVHIVMKRKLLCCI